MLKFPYCKLEIFLPASHLPALQEALAQVDAGHIGKYDHCLTYSPVTGCWRPLPGTAPYLGQASELCTASELKVEVTCQSSRLEETLHAIRRVHPYEEPVINVIPLLAVGADINAAEVFQEAAD
ncbi:MAG: cytochrome C biogenesis protein [Dysosmobacter sp.]